VVYAANQQLTATSSCFKRRLTYSMTLKQIRNQNNLIGTFKT